MIYVINENEIKTVGAIGCDDDIRVILEDGKDKCLNCYGEGLGRFQLHRNCGGQIAWNRRQVVCLKCHEVLFDTISLYSKERQEEIEEGEAEANMDNFIRKQEERADEIEAGWHEVHIGGDSFEECNAIGERY